MKFKPMSSIHGFVPAQLPRLGKIHLGVKMPNGDSEYPKEVDYFVVPPEVQAVYGEKPKLLHVVFPVDAQDQIAPFAYKKYGAVGLVCKGDGQAYQRIIDGAMTEGECPTPEECPFALDGQGRTVCKAVMNLQVMLWKVSVGGVYQIDTGSFNSMKHILATLEFCRSIFKGRVRGIPMLLSRDEQETQFTDPKTGKTSKGRHWPLKLSIPTHEERRLLSAEISALLPEAKDRPIALPAPSEKEIEGHLYPRQVVQKVLETGGGTGEPSNGGQAQAATPPPSKLTQIAAQQRQEPPAATAEQFCTDADGDQINPDTGEVVEPEPAAATALEPQPQPAAKTVAPQLPLAFQPEKAPEAPKPATAAKKSFKF